MGHWVVEWDLGPIDKNAPLCEIRRFGKIRHLGDDFEKSVHASVSRKVPGKKGREPKVPFPAKVGMSQVTVVTWAKGPLENSTLPGSNRVPSGSQADVIPAALPTHDNIFVSL